MSLLINIIGNVATGKSTLSKALASNLDIPHISIDGFRKRYYNGSIEAEQKAQDALIYALIRPQLIILEHSGTGRYRYVYQRTFDTTITIMCKQPSATIRRNIENRTEAHDPYIPLAWQHNTSRIQGALDAATAMGELLIDEPYTYTYNYKTDSIEQLSDNIREYIDE